MNDRPYAECAVLAINEIVQRLAQSFEVDIQENQYQEVETKDSMKFIGSNKNGLYMFFVKLRDTDQTPIPVYVGYTGQSFSERFKKHAAVDKFFDGQKISPQNYLLCVSEFPFLPSTAKLLESVFLNAFDFPFNLIDNGKMQARNVYLNVQDRITLHQGKERFKGSCLPVMKEIEKISKGME